MIDPKHFIDDFSEHSPFEAFYKNGIKPEDIKHGIIETLTPHFQNHDRLVPRLISSATDNGKIKLQFYT